MASQDMTSRMEGAKASAESLRDEATKVAGRVSEAAKAGVETAREKISEGYDTARHYADDAYQHARHYAEDAYHKAREKGTEAVDSLEGSIRSNPLAAIAVAAGVGVLVGLWMRR